MTIEELAEQLAAEKARADAAEAACAEMRESLSRVSERAWFKDYMQKEHEHVNHALSSDYGKGWLSPEVREKVRKAFQKLYDSHDTFNHHYESGRRICGVCFDCKEAKEALALLDKEQK